MQGALPHDGPLDGFLTLQPVVAIALKEIWARNQGFLKIDDVYELPHGSTASSNTIPFLNPYVLCFFLLFFFERGPFVPQAQIIAILMTPGLFFKQCYLKTLK